MSQQINNLDENEKAEALFYTAQAEDWTRVASLLEGDCDSENPLLDPSLILPFFHAAIMAERQIDGANVFISHLLDQEENRRYANELDQDGRSPLRLAILRGHESRLIIRTLIWNDAQITPEIFQLASEYDVLSDVVKYVDEVPPAFSL